MPVSAKLARGDAFRDERRRRRFPRFLAGKGRTRDRLATAFASSSAPRRARYHYADAGEAPQLSREPGAEERLARNRQGGTSERCWLPHGHRIDHGLSQTLCNSRLADSGRAIMDTKIVVHGEVVINLAGQPHSRERNCCRLSGGRAGSVSQKADAIVHGWLLLLATSLGRAPGT